MLRSSSTTSTRAFGVAGVDDVVALAPKEDLQELLHAALVVDDENAGLRAHVETSVRGSRIRNVVPTPKRLSNRTLPP